MVAVVLPLEDLEEGEVGLGSQVPPPPPPHGVRGHRRHLSSPPRAPSFVLPRDLGQDPFPPLPQGQQVDRVKANSLSSSSMPSPPPSLPTLARSLAHYPFF